MRELRSTFLQALPAEIRSTLLRGARWCEFAEGETLFFKGDEGSWLFLVESGLVEISLLSAQGKKAILNHQGEGELIGELAVLDAGPRSADALALRPTSGYRLQKAELVQVLQQDNQACLEVIKLLCSRMRNASENFESRIFAPAASRLARCLLSLADKWGQADGNGGIQVSQPFSQAELGEFSGLARENVNRLLRGWQADGWVRYHQGEIHLLDRAALQACRDSAAG